MATQSTPTDPTSTLKKGDRVFHGGLSAPGVINSFERRFGDDGAHLADGRAYTTWYPLRMLTVEDPNARIGKGSA